MKKRCREEQPVGQLEQDWVKAVIDADDNELLLALSWREIVRLDARRRFLDYMLINHNYVHTLRPANGIQ